MERRVANTFPGPPPQPPVPYYHNNYNHPHHHHHHHPIHPPPPQPPHHHVAAVGFHQFPQNGDQRFNQPPPHFDNNQYPVVQQQQNMIGEHTPPFPPPNGGFSPCGSGLRKRRAQSATGLSPDPTSDGGSVAKLYVAAVSKTASEDDIRQVFAKFGNVTEIILPKDKMTGERAAYCFVKYKKIEEANAAIAGLTDQYTFPGEMVPVKVRYADAERERIGFPIVQVPDKLYVRCLNKLTTRAEVHEVFGRYGVIEDIYMALDDMKISRGYAFVQFSRREMALAAIKGLNGIFTMRGSDQPLIVRFADPKKSRLGETRPTFNAPPPQMQQQFDQNWHSQQPPPQYPQWGNNVVPHHHDFASQPNQFPQQQNAQAITSSKPVHKPIHFQDNPKPETAILETRSDSNTVSTECDWSEHTCPDGNKYYFHCLTCESTWEKPEEYSMFEKWFQEQTKLLNQQGKVENDEQVQANLLQQPSTTTDQENNLVHPLTRLPVETCS